jgi:hypothetical protein
MILFLLACAGQPELPDTGDTGSYLEIQTNTISLDVLPLLRRISLDFRGVPLTLAELGAVEAELTGGGDSEQIIDDWTNKFLNDERVEERLVHLLSEKWLTKLDQFNIRYDQLDLPAIDEFEYERSVGEEPLRLIANITMSDVPWTDVVTADFTMANEMLSSIWPIDYPEGETGWQRSYYNDGRPAGGLMMSNGLWWRYYTTPFNYNRRRAATIVKLLLCEDYLSRPVSLSDTTNILEDGADEAISNNDACQSCHVTMDPLAAGFFGFWWFDIYDPEELSVYHVSREHLGETFLDTRPEWFGVAFDSPQEMAEIAAADPRVVSCAVDSFSELLWRRPTELVDFPRLNQIRGAFERSGLRGTDLLVEITKSPEYRAGSLLSTATDDDVARERTARQLSPSQLASSVEALTGFEWTWQGYDQLDNDTIGYRILAGGVNGWSVTAISDSPGFSFTLVLERLSEAAGSWVVSQGIGEDSAGLLNLVGDGIEASSQEFTDQLVLLHRAFHGFTPGEELLELDRALWVAISAQEGPSAAWAGLISALIRDPSFWSY